MTRDMRDVQRNDGGPASALAAGLAPPGTPGGEDVTARRYGHPYLGARPVVRLTARPLAPIEDRLLADLGYTAPDTGDPVAAGHLPELRYPAWALVHDLAHAEAALTAGVEMARAGRLVGPRPGPALDDFQRIAATLPLDHLPLFWEEVGRMFVAAGRDKQGALMFGRARAADRHATAGVDPAGRRAVFLEFALAGALSAKDIKAYVAELAQGPDPLAAYRELRDLAVRRTTGGLPPWPEMLKQLGKLAKSAGLDVATEHRLVLEDLVDTPALWRAADTFWTAQRKLLVPAVTASAVLRQRLLWRLADVPPSDLDAWWCGLLVETGALDGLGGGAGAGAAGEGSAEAGVAGAGAEGGGAAGEWLSALLCRYGDASAPAVPAELLRLPGLLADRIPDDGAPVRFGSGAPGDYCGIDAVALVSCLEAGVPVADPGPGAALRNWEGFDDAGLRALLADERFGPVLARSVPQGAYDHEEFRALWGRQALRPVLREIVDGNVLRVRSGGLTAAGHALRWLEDNLRSDMLTDRPDLAARLTGLDLVTPLARTLRAGILDELGWAALDEAAAEMKGGRFWCRASWPVLTVHDRGKAVAIDPGGRIAEHRMRVPSEASRFDHTPRAYFSDGQFLVLHYVNGRQSHYWSDAPDELFDVRPGLWESLHHEPARPGYTFMAPSGRRFMGHRVLDPHEERVGPNGHMFHDGGDFWWLTEDAGEPQVRRIDLTTGDLAAPGAALPDFFDPSHLGEHERWNFTSSSLAPLPYGVKESPLGSDGVRVGLRIAQDEVTGQVRYYRVDGVHGVLDGSGSTAVWGLLDLPGTDRPLVLSGGVGRYDPVVARDAKTGEPYWHAELKNDGWTSTEPDAMAAGTRLIPPPAFWHFLAPRDPAGSAALRRLTEDAVRDLLAAAATSEESLRTAVGKLLPDVGHPLLARGVAGCVQAAADLAARGERLLTRLSRPAQGV
ncbi:hypothetical protein [Streptomyces sp. RK9]|uniref:hypothetical protein n=1 Tax=Streptomyces sp. RK9 TaxID=3239284 RepID=UPI0038655787